MQAEIRRIVKGMNGYMIRFSELKENRETFEFILEESFFKFYQCSDWEGGKISVHVEAKQRADGITLDFTFAGYLRVVCDRCLDTYILDLSFEEQLFIKYGLKDEEIEDNIVIISRDENKIDLSKHFYEYLVLSLPVKKIHPDKMNGESGCNAKMIEKLEEHMIKNESDLTDSRWEDLKKLLDKN